MPTDTPTRPSLDVANGARKFYALDRAIRHALTACTPITKAHRRALAALLLGGIER